MSRFFSALWRVIKFPFVLLFGILTFPLLLIRRAYLFLNDHFEEEPPLMDGLANLATETQARASFWDHVEALRMHLLRMIIGLAVGVGVAVGG